jgi:predicted nucleic acid-binding protein
VRPIAVFDTNVLFSGVAWKGKPFQCLELARAGVVDGVTHIVTGDRRHLLPLGVFQGIPIVTVADFLAAASAP